MTALAADPRWRAQARPEGLVVYAGADLTYLIPDLTAEQAGALAALFDPATGGTVDPRTCPARLRPVLPQLRSLGALRPAELPAPDRPRALKVGIRMAGSTSVPLDVALYEAFPPVPEPDLLVLVRTTATLRELTELAGELATGRPYLLLDLAYHHTVSVGPLVVPGGTACVACLAVRAGRRWGDPPPATRPGAAAEPDFAVALAAHAVRRIAAGSLALLERFVDYHLDELTTTSEHVLPAADCPVCPGLPAAPAALPWEGTRR
ncbi:hypothetical protein [Amycolatopsis anabasis]|uniref:hypothetical protein n=1 Tax=Amycolatopsis anabasis TaxID=1840409 RepID=UPI00131BFCC0|nr:hypothetical protein [Amycolatopsis anabasis]